MSSYNQLFQQYLNYYNNPDTAQAPEVSIAKPPSQGNALVNQGAGLAGKGAGMYAGGKLGGALFGGGKLAAPKLVGAKVIGGNAPLTLTANPALPASYTGAAGAGAKGGAGLLGGAGATAGLGAMAALYGAGLYNYGGRNILEGDAKGDDWVDAAMMSNPVTAPINPLLDVFGLPSLGELGDSIWGSGKSKYQQAREATRGKLAELGLLKALGGKVFEADFEGQDPFRLGRSGDYYSDSYDRSIKDLSRVLGRDAEKMANNKRMGWDIDYTSDLDMLTSTVSKDLGRLLSGGELNKNLMHGFNELTNASLADTDREFNKENWANTMGDMRSLYERAGFEDANAAYGRLNELVGSGAIDDKAKEEIMQSIGMAYGDNSFDLANQINQGRWTGVDMEGAGIANDINLPLDPLANVDTTNLVLKPGTLSQEQAEMLAGALA